MDIILKDDVKGLGFKNDTLTVKNGYGRNYLIPQGLAVPATDSNRKMLAENVKQASHKAEKLRQDAATMAEDIVKALETNPLVIPTKAGESGRIFGKVTSLQVADMLKSRGFDVDRKKIDFPQEIKSLGQYPVTLLLHREVKQQITIEVVEE